MNEKQIFDAIGMIDESAVLDAKVYRAPATNLWLKIGAVAACLTIAIGGTALLFGRGKGLFDKSDHRFPQGENMPTDNGSQVAPDGLLVPYMQWNINRGERIPNSMNMDVELTSYGSALEQSAEWQEGTDAFFTHTGILYDELAKNIPDEMRDSATLYTMASPYEGSYRHHDYVFNYYGENAAHIEVAVCHFEAPLRDICFESLTEPSYINGTEAMVVAFSDTDYYAAFCDEGIWYDITAQVITLEEMQGMLIGIADLK